MFNQWLVIYVFIVSVVVVIEMYRIENLKKRINLSFGIFKYVFKYVSNMFKNIEQYERILLQMIDEISKYLEQHEESNQLKKDMKTLRDFRIHMKEMSSRDHHMPQTLQEALDELERFDKLSKELSLEEFKEEAKKYFDEKLQETYETIDNAWGDDLMIACEKQNRIKAKWEKVKETSTTEEALEAMF